MHAHVPNIRGKVAHHHDVGIVLVIDDVHRILSAVHDCCLNLLLGKCLQHPKKMLTLKFKGSEAAVEPKQGPGLLA